MTNFYFMLILVGDVDEYPTSSLSVVTKENADSVHGEKERNPLSDGN